MGILNDIKLNNLKKKINDKKEQFKSNGKFLLYHTKYVEKIVNELQDYEKLEYMCSMIDSWENTCNLPYNVGVSLDLLVENTDVVVAIHRTNLQLDRENSGLSYSDKLLSIMNNGLINYGHANAIGGPAFSNTIPDISLTMSPLTGLSGYINLISSYKNNDGVILAVFPKAKYDTNGNLISGCVDEDLHIVDKRFTNQIYDVSDKFPVIRPEFIIGAILKKDNNFDEFYTREEIINVKSKKY